MEFTIVLKGPGLENKDMDKIAQRLKRVVTAEFGNEDNITCVAYRKKYVGSSPYYSRIKIL